MAAGSSATTAATPSAVTPGTLVTDFGPRVDVTMLVEQRPHGLLAHSHSHAHVRRPQPPVTHRGVAALDAVLEAEGTPTSHPSPLPDSAATPTAGAGTPTPSPAHAEGGHHPTLHRLESLPVGVSALAVASSTVLLHGNPTRSRSPIPSAAPAAGSSGLVTAPLPVKSTSSPHLMGLAAPHVTVSSLSLGGGADGAGAGVDAAAAARPAASSATEADGSLDVSVLWPRPGGPHRTPHLPPDMNPNNYAVDPLTNEVVRRPSPPPSPAQSSVVSAASPGGGASAAGSVSALPSPGHGSGGGGATAAPASVRARAYAWVPIDPDHHYKVATKACE